MTCRPADAVPEAVRHRRHAFGLVFQKREDGRANGVEFPSGPDRWLRCAARARVGARTRARGRLILLGHSSVYILHADLKCLRRGFQFQYFVLIDVD
jgi:hypothetical protein